MIRERGEHFLKQAIRMKGLTSPPRHKEVSLVPGKEILPRDKNLTPISDAKCTEPKTSTYGDGRRVVSAADNPS